MKRGKARDLERSKSVKQQKKQDTLIRAVKVKGRILR
jgi:hypothetical protein